MSTATSTATTRVTLDRAPRHATSRALSTGRLGVGRIWGIEIAVHASWFLVYALVASSLAAGYFPTQYPGWAPVTYWLAGALAALAFFASVLVHELGHSWVALRHGIPIRAITLFVFGGVAQISREPTSPRVEFEIAVAGPLTSVGLAGLFAAAWIATKDVPVVAGPLFWLASVNLIVAVFNLVPGFPLDGGRVLRAVVWSRTGSFDRATHVAALAGRVVSALLMAFGVFTALGGDVLSGLWILFIGWFLENAAVATEAEAGFRNLLRGVRVVQVMTRECARIARDHTLAELVRVEVLGAGRRCFLVTDEDRLAGLVTLHQVKDVPPGRRDTVRAEDVMTPTDQLVVVRPDESVLAALERMDDGGVAQLPVLADGRLLGMVGREEILRYVRTRTELGV